MNVQAQRKAQTAPVRREMLRIAGKKVAGQGPGAIDVLNPYNNALVGTVERASRAQVAEAFQIAADYKPKLTRYERQKILMRTAELLVARRKRSPI